MIITIGYAVLTQGKNLVNNSLRQVILINGESYSIRVRNKLNDNVKYFMGNIKILLNRNKCF